MVFAIKRHLYRYLTNIKMTNLRQIRTGVYVVLPLSFAMRQPKPSWLFGTCHSQMVDSYLK